MDLVESGHVVFRHPWELSRADSISGVISAKVSGRSFLDIGAGDLYFSKLLLSNPGRSVIAVDINFDDKVSSESGPRLKTVKTLEEVPVASVDCALAMDVLEHVEDDEAFLRDVISKVADRGTILITVPAWQFLFSAHDVFLKHHRRYRLNRLKSLAELCGLKVQETFYFYTGLFFARVFQKLISKVTSPKQQVGVGGWKWREDSLITVAFRGVLNCDFLLCRGLARLGLRLPGLSCCLLCVKKSV
jgi:SAM-dependent methyltransferase